MHTHCQDSDPGFTVSPGNSVLMSFVGSSISPKRASWTGLLSHDGLHRRLVVCAPVCSRSAEQHRHGREKCLEETTEAASWAHIYRRNGVSIVCRCSLGADERVGGPVPDVFLRLIPHLSRPWPLIGSYCAAVERTFG